MFWIANVESKELVQIFFYKHCKIFGFWGQVYLGLWLLTILDLRGCNSCTLIIIGEQSPATLIYPHLWLLSHLENRNALNIGKLIHCYYGGAITACILEVIKIVLKLTVIVVTTALPEDAKMYEGWKRKGIKLVLVLHDAQWVKYQYLPYVHLHICVQFVCTYWTFLTLVGRLQHTMK